MKHPQAAKTGSLPLASTRSNTPWQIDLSFVGVSASEPRNPIRAGATIAGWRMQTEIAPCRRQRVIQITYPGTNEKSVFSYDGFGRCVEIDEYTGSSTPSSKKAFIWCGSARCETRDAANSYALLNQFFSRGESISGTSYYFTKDHLGSVREMTNSSGTIVWQQSFDPYGQPTTLVSTTPADMGYAQSDGSAFINSRNRLLIFSIGSRSCSTSMMM